MFGIASTSRLIPAPRLARETESSAAGKCWARDRDRFERGAVNWLHAGIGVKAEQRENEGAGHPQELLQVEMVLSL